MENVVGFELHENKNNTSATISRINGIKVSDGTRTYIHTEIRMPGNDSEARQECGKICYRHGDCNSFSVINNYCYLSHLSESEGITVETSPGNALYVRNAEQNCHYTEGMDPSIWGGTEFEPCGTFLASNPFPEIVYPPSVSTPSVSTPPGDVDNEDDYFLSDLFPEDYDPLFGSKKSDGYVFIGISCLFVNYNFIIENEINTMNNFYPVLGVLYRNDFIQRN